MKKILLAVSLFITALSASAQLPVYLDETKPMEQRVQDALSKMTLEEKTRLCYAQSKFTSPGVPRLGIPELYMSDGPHGVRMEINWNDWAHSGWTNDAITAFPALTCLAATWNPDLALLYGQSVGEEARYRKKNILLGPGVNIYRTPLNGRNFEYMGEDPMLSGTMAAPYIQGLQSKGVACCLKHYALNNQELHRGDIDVHVSDRALYEIYLPAFKKAVQEGGAWSIMGAYNRVWGQHATHNERLNNTILKGEWGFDGAVITDWGACHDTDEAIRCGLDIEMGSYTNGLTSEANGYGYDDYFLGNAYLEKCKKGEVPESIINDKAARILRLIFRSSKQSGGYGCINSPEHIAAARQIANEGIVLLKNAQVKGLPKGESLLPLSAEKIAMLQKLAKKSDKLNVLVVGNNTTHPNCPGGGSSELKAKDEVSPLRGIQERFGNNINIMYAQGYEVGRAMYGRYDKISESLQDSLYNDAIEKAKQADLIIYIGGLNKNHGQDCEGGDRETYEMSYGQDKLISNLVAVQPNTIVVIVSGNAVAMPWLQKVPALVQSWYLGSEAGHALADVLSGDVNPSGKTVFSYGYKLEDYPAHQFGERSYPGIRGEKSYYPREENAPEQWYDEDIFVGYRWFDTKKKPVMFPFGYGLSYTTFAYGKGACSDPVLTSKDGKFDGVANIRFTVDVKNTGKVEGKEVVQLYIGDDKASVARPKKELKAFSKVSLKPGEQKEVEFIITHDDLKYFDADKHEWVLEPGTFKAYIGASSADIKTVVPFTVK